MRFFRKKSEDVIHNLKIQVDGFREDIYQLSDDNEALREINIALMSKIRRLEEDSKGDE